VKRYEAMFLFDTATTRDWAAIEQEVRRLLERIGANLLVCVKYDERKLAYEIRRRKRGTYVLTYFDAPPEKLQELERDTQLSELVLRLLVLRTEISEEKLAALKAHSPETPLCPAGDGRRHDDDRYGSGDRRPRRDQESYDRGPAGDAVPALESADESGASGADEA